MRTVPVRPRARLLGAVLAAAAAVLLAGCGAGAGAGADPGPSAAQRVRDAVTATRAAGTAEVALDARVGVAGGFDLRGQGLLALAAPAAADLTLAVPALGTVRVLSVAGTLYAALPPAAAFFTGGRTWLALDAQRLESSAIGRPLAAAGLAEPARLVDVSAIGADARLVGPEPVDGVPATHYAGTLPPVAGAAPVAVDVWVDDGGRLRRVVRTPTGTTDPRPVGSSTVTVTATGVPGTVGAPPPDEVGDGARFLPGGF